MRVNALTIVVQIVMPAEGPSLGMAPAGTWTWKSRPATPASGTPSSPARVRAQVRAAHRRRAGEQAARSRVQQRPHLALIPGRRPGQGQVQPR